MSSEIELHRPTIGQHLHAALPDLVAQLPAVAELAKMIGSTAFVPDSYRNKPAEITACILYGAELGVPPMTALQKIDVVQGHPAPRAELGRTLAFAAGHEVWIDESTISRCVARGRRRGSDTVHTTTWTMDDAKRAGLTGKAPWRAYPKQMLVARATGELIRLMCPEVLAGIATFAEELDDDDATPVAAVADTDAKPTRRRRRAPEPAPVPAPAEAVADDDDVIEGEVVDVDLDEAPPTVDPPSTGHQPSAGQMRALHASLNDAGITDRADRLAFVSAAISRPVESSRDITSDEAGAVIDAAQRVAAGTVAVTFDEAGHWLIVPLDAEDGGAR